MTRSPWNFVAASSWIIWSGRDCDGGRVVGADGVAQRSGELGELAVALDATELRGGGEHAGGHPPQAHVAASSASASTVGSSRPAPRPAKRSSAGSTGHDMRVIHLLTVGVSQAAVTTAIGDSVGVHAVLGPRVGRCRR